jgi:cell well associated rhsD protein
MKKIFLFLIACFSIVECVGHDIQSNENASLPAESLTKRLHGRKTTEYRFNGTDYNATVTYYDGLGRPEQRIAVGASPAGKDRVEFSVYDRMGRADSVTFLPYTITGTGGYRSNPHLEQRNFYKAYTNNAPDADYAYNLKEYDDSPLGVETGYSGPGIYHSAHSASGHPVKISYRLNYTPDKM